MDRMMPAEGALVGEVIPPTLAAGNKNVPTTRIKLASPAHVREEMSRVYRLARYGKIRIEDATRLCYMLDRISQAMRSEAELEAMQTAYADAFTGLTIKLAPPKPEEIAR